MVVGEVVEIVGGEAVGVNVTCISMKGMVASRDTTKTQGMVPMAAAGITGEGDTTNPQTTTPQPKPTAVRTEGTHRIAIIRITNRADTEVHLNRHMIRGPRINHPPTGVVEEGTTLDTMALMAGQTGTLGGEEAHLPIEETVRRTVVAGMAIEEVREGGIDMVALVVDTAIPRRTPVIVGVATIEAEVINLVGAINLVEVTSPAEVTSPLGVINPEVISLAGRTVQASNPMGAEGGITREVVVVGEDTNHEKTDAYTVLANGPAAWVRFVHFSLLL